MSLTISSIQDKNYEVMDDIQLMAEQVCNGPPINFDIARFKTDGVIYITMLHYQAQSFKKEILQKYDNLKIHWQPAQWLQEIHESPDEYPNANFN